MHNDNLSEFITNGKYSEMSKNLEPQFIRQSRSSSFCEILENPNLNFSDLTTEYMQLNCYSKQSLEILKSKYPDFSSIDSKDISNLILDIKSTSDKYLSADKVLTNHITKN